MLIVRVAAIVLGLSAARAILAPAFDKYLERLERFVERERSFTASASHELRTPLSVMMGAVDVLAANPQSLVQIAVGNLLRNAIEHTPAGRIAIYIDERHITISNTVEGIGAEQLATILESTVSSKSGGTGLGLSLSLVKRICDRLGWRISIESERSVGTTAGITFS